MSLVKNDAPFAANANKNHLLIDSMFDESLPAHSPGDFQYEHPAEGRQAYFWLACPKCGSVSPLAVRPVVDPMRVSNSWELSGDEKHPTLTPSIDHKGCWHGWLNNGKFTQA